MKSEFEIRETARELLEYKKRLVNKYDELFTEVSENGISRTKYYGDLSEEERKVFRTFWEERKRVHAQLEALSFVLYDDNVLTRKAEHLLGEIRIF